jgi:hypothetical protein
MRDSLGVPLNPEELPHELVAYDWLSRPIFSDDNEEFILIDGEYVLDEPDEIRAYVMQHAVILDTMQIYEEVKHELI